MYKFFVYLLIGSLSLFFLACNEDVTKSGEILTNKTVPDPPSNIGPNWLLYNWESESSINPSNEENSYDKVGQEHNNACDYITWRFNELTTLPEGEAFLDSIIYFVADFQIIFGSQTARATIFQNYQDHLYADSVCAEYIDYLEYYSESDEIAAEKEDFVELFFDNSGTMTITEMINYAKPFESSMINNQNFTSEEKEEYLSFMSTFRFSLAYWYDVESGLRSDFDDIGLGAEDENNPEPPSKTRAQHDAHHKKVSPGSRKWENSVASYAAKAVDTIGEGIEWVGDISAFGRWLQS